MKLKFWQGNKKLKQALTGYLFLGPNIVGFMTFVFLPVLGSLFLAFAEWDLLNPPKFIGLKNFAIRLSSFV